MQKGTLLLTHDVFVPFFMNYHSPASHVRGSLHSPQIAAVGHYQSSVVGQAASHPEPTS